MTTQPDKCREAFEKWEDSDDAGFLDDDNESPVSIAEKVWQAAWNAATVQPTDAQKQAALGAWIRIQNKDYPNTDTRDALMQRILTALQCRALLRAAQYAVDDQEYIGTVRIETMRDLKSALEWAEKQRMSYELQGGGYDEVIYLDDLIRAATAPKNVDGLVKAAAAVCKSFEDHNHVFKEEIHALEQALALLGGKVG